MIRTAILLSGLLAASSALAQEKEALPGPFPPAAPERQPGAPEPEPVVRKLDDGKARIGEVTVDAKTREIRFPATVNMAGSELLEFAIVHVKGKIHESLLATTASPLHLNVAFQLLRYQASPELYALPAEEGRPGPRFPEVTPEVKAASRFEVHVEWKDGERARTSLINEWISDITTGRPMPADPWVYGGSATAGGKFAASATGDIFAIYLSSTALANFPGKNNQSDEVWLPFPQRVPSVGTQVTVIIRPYSNPLPRKP